MDNLDMMDTFVLMTHKNVFVLIQNTTTKTPPRKHSSAVQNHQHNNTTTSTNTKPPTPKHSSTTPYYRVLLQYYSSTTKYYSVLQSTTPVLQRYYSSTTKSTPVLLRTTKYYSSTTPYYKVLLRTGLASTLVSTLLGSFLSHPSGLPCLRPAEKHLLCQLPFAVPSSHGQQTLGRRICIHPTTAKYSFRRSSALVSLTSRHVLCCTMVCSQLLHCCTVPCFRKAFQKSRVSLISLSNSFTSRGGSATLSILPLLTVRPAGQPDQLCCMHRRITMRRTPHCRQEVAQP